MMQRKARNDVYSFVFLHLSYKSWSLFNEGSGSLECQVSGCSIEVTACLVTKGMTYIVINTE